MDGARPPWARVRADPPPARAAAGPPRRRRAARARAEARGQAPAADGAPRMTSARKIAANTIYRAVADLGSKVATVALFVVMARKLGEAHFGVFTFALSFVTLV